jgi:hypothetical protein
MDEARGLRGLSAPPADAVLDGEADADPARDVGDDRGEAGSRSRGEERNAAEARTGMPDARGDRDPELDPELARGEEDEARVDDAERRGEAAPSLDGEAARVVERERAEAPLVTGTGMREPERAGLNSSFFAARSLSRSDPFAAEAACSRADEAGEGEREREGERATVAGMAPPEPAGRRCVAGYFSSCCAASAVAPPCCCCCSSAARTCRYCGRGVGLPSGRREL